MDLRILADDLTGALDAAAAFAGEVPVWLDAPGPHDGNAVSVVATATRDVAPGELPTLLAPSLDWLRGADIAFKKVDSLLRGNTFAECALAARERFRRVVFAPAFPRQGRVTVDGRAWVTQPGSSARQPIGKCAIADAFEGMDIPALWVPEVSDDEALRRLAAQSHDAASRGWLWCGSAGLAHALAGAHGREARAAPMAPSAEPPLLVSASHHPVVQRQWSRLRASLPASPRWFDLAPTTRLTRTQATALLAEQARSIARREPRPHVLVAVGGDTLRALCAATGARSLSASASPRPGWGRARLVGGLWDGTVLHSRSGAFGADDDLLEVVAALSG